jgi:general secretion pathway protein G
MMTRQLSLLPARDRDGFTLLELMVVLLILALLTSIAAPRAIKHLGKAKAQSARIQIDALGAALESFHLDVGRVPTTEEGLEALLVEPSDAAGWSGPYLKKRASLLDPWGRPYIYLNRSALGEFQLSTLGADAHEGGSGEAADVRYEE